MKNLPVGQRNLALVALAVILLGTGCASNLRHAQNEAVPKREDLRKISLGLCEDYPEESRSIAAARRDFQVLATNNIRVLRIAFGWDAMEPEPGKYDWRFWDDFVRIATDEYRIRLIPYICYTPRWASSSTNQDFWQQPPNDNARFADFMKRIVTRYRDRIHSWEIWNEPDNPAYWRGTPEQFAQLLAAGSRAVRESDPHAQVVMGGLAWNLSFLEEIINTPAAITNVDVINLHNYYETWSSDPLEHLPDYIGHAADLLRQHRLHQQLWMAEVGYSSFREGATVSGQYQAWFQHEHTPAAQAASVFRAMTLLLASGKVSLAAWYRINDLPGAQEVIGDVNNRHLGILNERGEPKPALHALSRFQSLFADGFRCLDNDVTITKRIGAPVEAHAFQTANGNIVVIAWLQTYVPGTRDDVASGKIVDRRSANISLNFPFPLGANASITDEVGNPSGALTLERHGNSSELPNLRLRGDRIAVIQVSASSE